MCDSHGKDKVKAAKDSEKMENASAFLKDNECSTRTFTEESAVQTGTPASLHLTPCKDTNTDVQQRERTKLVTPSVNILRSVHDINFPSTSNQANHVSGDGVVVSIEKDDKLVDATIRPTNISDEADNERICWICHSTDEDKLAWVQPCKCRGTIKWVHERCLYRWVDEKQKGNALSTVSCQQCKTDYIIVFPQMEKVANILEAFDNILSRESPFLTSGIIVGFSYWSAVSYGAVTFWQVVGYEKGLALMKLCEPMFLLIALPFIPVCLVLGRKIHWEDAVIHLIRKCRSVARRLPLMNLVIPFPEEEQAEQNPVTPAMSRPALPSRILWGALLLPTISYIVGCLLFQSIESTMWRTLLGGLTFITVKGILKIYLKQQQYTRYKNFRIVKYTEENLGRYVNRNSSNRYEGGNPSPAANASSAQPQQAYVPRPRQSKAEYIIVFPQMKKLANILEAFDNIVNRVSPFLTAGIIMGFLYWNAISYGAVTFLLVVGLKNGVILMKLCDPILLLIGLSVIPVSLVLSRMIRWEEPVIHLFRMCRSVARELPLINLVIPFPEEDEEQAELNQVTPAPVVPSRIVCGALLLPTISFIVGCLLFQSIESTMRRTVLGGLTYITVKGILKIYLKQQQYTRNKKRRIVDYTEDNVRTYVNRDSSNRNDRGDLSPAAIASGAQPQQANVPRPRVNVT